jgi:hypothetical protein
MNKLTKLPLVLAFGGVVALGASSAASADVMASAVLETSNFTISNTAGVLDRSDFAFLTYTSTGGYAGTLPGTSGYNSSSSTSPVDLPMTCVGNGCAAFSAAYGAEDSLTHLVAPPAGNYSAADQLESGAPITGLAGLSAPATIGNAAYAGLTSQNALSHATSTNNLNSSFVFQVGSAGALTFDFDATAYLQAYVTGDERFPGFATASYTLNFTLTDLTTGAVVDVINPDVFNNGLNTISLNAPLPGTFQTIFSNSQTYSFTTAVLNSTDLYQLSARNNVNADVQRVPEPGEIALMGIGLLGMTLVARRRRNKGA